MDTSNNSSPNKNANSNINNNNNSNEESPKKESAKIIKNNPIKLVTESPQPIFKTIPIKKELLIKQTKITIENIEIYFPYEPYSVQIDYMKKVINTLSNKLNNELDCNGYCALESPTGTGKTLCLLCATIGWVNEMRKKKLYNGKIYYTTRTHSQVSQVIHELKKTIYKPSTAILSSREYSCINQSYKFSKNEIPLDIKCLKYNKQCPYYQGNYYPDERFYYDCMDIEELVKIANIHNFCPFYYERKKAKNENCDIVFMPYNYIFNKEIRNTLDIKLENNILIIDEAHNISNACEVEESFEITNDDFDEMIKDLKECLKFKEKNSISHKVRISKNIGSCNLKHELNAIKNIQKKFNDEKLVIKKGSYWPNKGLLLTPKEFLHIFLKEKENKENQYLNDKQLTIDSFFKQNKEKNKEKDEDNVNKDNENNENEEDDDSLNKISDYITRENISKHLFFLDLLIKWLIDEFSKRTKLSILESILELIKIFIVNEENIKSYNFLMNYVTKNHNNNNYYKNEIRKLNIYCFNPGIGFQNITKNNPFSVILTSGTLAPFDILEEELKIKFYTTLENKHIINDSQFKFSIIKGYNFSDNKMLFNFDYQNRTNNKMIINLGYLILSMTKIVKKGGILVYFTSYSYLNQCNKIWEKMGINKEICKNKKLLIDDKSDKEIITKFRNNKNNNSLLLSVFRGTSSEGIDFKDDFARMVICIGVPFANAYEDKVLLKKKYLNEKYNESLKCNSKKNKEIIRLNGRKWYVNDAISNVNQALGRVLRHKNDYGILICIDERFEAYYEDDLFSFWMRKNCEITNFSKGFIDELEEYFINHEEKNEIFKSNLISLKEEEENQKEEISNKKEEKYKDIKIDFILKKKIIKYEPEDDEDNYLKDNNIDIFNKSFCCHRRKRSEKNSEDKKEKINIEETSEKKEVNEKNNNINNYENIENIENDLDFLGQKYLNNNKQIENIDENAIFKTAEKNASEDGFNSLSKKVNNEEESYLKNKILNEIEQNNKLSDKLNKEYILNNKKNDNCYILEKTEKTLKNKINNTKGENKIFNEIFEERKNENENVIDYYPDEPYFSQINNNIYTIQTSDDFLCPICYKNSKDNYTTLQYSRSKCGHVLCNICWSNWLKEKLECPLCKSKVRIKTLTKLIFKNNIIS